MSQAAPSEEACTGPVFYRLIAAAASWLETNSAAVNALNVYPVPDGDTGTNMVLTLRTALREAEKSQEENVSVVASAIARGALLGARGNSGVILSQYLQGLARGLSATSVLSAADLAAALEEAANAAYGAMSNPVEGTMLTVARVAGEHARRTSDGSLGETFVAAAEGAEQAVEETPELLPVLKAAGVVDSGGQGLALLLRAVANVYTGRGFGPPLEATTLLSVNATWLEDQDEEEWGFCTEFVLIDPTVPTDVIRGKMAAFGRSESIVEGDGIVRVHLHTATPEDVLTEAGALGGLEQVAIRDMDQQHKQFVADHTSDGEALQCGMVTVATGPGFVRLMRSLGAGAIIWGGQTMNPSAEEIAEAVESIPSQELIVLPNNKNIIAACELAKDLTTKRLHILPTVSVLQGVTSLLAYNPADGADPNLDRMQDALQAIRWAEVTHAVRSGDMDGVAYKEGQAIGLLEGDIVTAYETPLETVCDLVQRMQPPPDALATLYYGAGISKEEAQATADAVVSAYPEVEVEVIDGGQPLYPYLVSLEG